MHMDKNANINFVNKFEISQFYEAGNQNKFLPEKTSLALASYCEIAVAVFVNMVGVEIYLRGMLFIQ